MNRLSFLAYRWALGRLDRRTVDVTQAGPAALQAMLAPASEPPPCTLPPLYRDEYRPCPKCGVLVKGAHSCAQQVEARVVRFQKGGK